MGFHVSIADRLDKAVDRAVERGCNTFQVFTRNPRGWAISPLDEGEAQAFTAKVEAQDMRPVFAHMPYLTNLASPREDIYRLSRGSLKAELQRCQKLQIPYIVTHLGSHLGAGMEEGVKRITAALNEALAQSGGEVTVLLENTAGTQHSMGTRFEEIQRILENAERRDLVGVCLDISHAFAGGYEFRTERGLNRTLHAFDSVIGLERLRLIHANDSRAGLGSRIDRHEHIGMGYIGEQGFKTILRSRLSEHPMILETPIDQRRDDRADLERLKELAGAQSLTGRALAEYSPYKAFRRQVSEQPKS
ncbi:MAG: deoxyribonuclease IV [Candidatus Bathyarchaeia archaeon]